MIARLERFLDIDAVAEKAAGHFVSTAREAIEKKGRFSVVLSGGSTPEALYRKLAAPPLAHEIDWSRIHTFWGDERVVPPDHSDSNFRMAWDILLHRVPIPPDHVHRIHGELDPYEAADSYEQTLCNFLTDAGAGDPDSISGFDLVLLGMGEDGHTASLFPGSEAVRQVMRRGQGRWVVADYIEKLASWRITLTPILINASANVIFLVAGSGKAETLERVLHGPKRPQELPAQLIRPLHGELTWMVDEAAGRLLHNDLKKDFKKPFFIWV